MVNQIIEGDYIRGPDGIVRKVLKTQVRDNKVFIKPVGFTGFFEASARYEKVPEPRIYNQTCIIICKDFDRYYAFTNHFQNLNEFFWDTYKVCVPLNTINIILNTTVPIGLTIKIIHEMINVRVSSGTLIIPEDTQEERTRKVIKFIQEYYNE